MNKWKRVKKKLTGILKINKVCTHFNTNNLFLHGEKRKKERKKERKKKGR